MKWNYDPLSNKRTLLRSDTNVNASDGLYTIAKVENRLINNVMTQVVVNETYYFDKNGDMVTGWIKTSDNVWLFFDTNIQTLGTGIKDTWKIIDNKWYCFDENGKLYQSTVTNDGHIVDANGELVK